MHIKINQCSSSSVAPQDDRGNRDAINTFGYNRHIDCQAERAPHRMSCPRFGVLTVVVFDGAMCSSVGITSALGSSIFRSSRYPDLRSRSALDEMIPATLIPLECCQWSRESIVRWSGRRQGVGGLATESRITFCHHTPRFKSILRESVG